MCYAFTEQMACECWTNLEGSQARTPERSSGPAAHLGDSLARMSGKRVAEDSVSSKPVKAARLSSETTTEGMLEETKAPENSDDELAALQRRLDKSEALVKTRDEHIAELEDWCDTIHHRLLRYETVPPSQKDPIKAEEARGRAIGMAMVKKEREHLKSLHRKNASSLRQDYDQKIEAVKKRYRDRAEAAKDRHEGEKRTKDAAHQKKIAEIKEKARVESDGFRETKNQYQEEKKAMKAEHEEIQKQLKAEQRDEVRNLKPEHSKTIKEKDAALVDKQTEIDRLEERLDLAKQTQTGLETKICTLNSLKEHCENALKQKHEHYGDLEAMFTSRDAEVTRLTQENKSLQEAHAAEIAHEGKRWRLQYEKAERATRFSVEQQRANFALRHGIDRKTEKIEELEAEIMGLKAELHHG